MKVVRILVEPPESIGMMLSKVLVGLQVKLRDVILQSAMLPTFGKDVLLLLNDDIHQALRDQIGVSEAYRYFPLLPLGRVTPIPKHCCSEPIEV